MRTTTTVSSSESESPIIMNKDDDYDEKTASDDDNNGIIIIGGGLAGLAAAVRLETKNVPYVLLESSDGFGGRARTDIVDGYILDRGFAIYLSSYEECNKIFDTKALDLRKFYAGADVRFENQFYRVADPFRHVSDALPSLLPNHKIGSPLDKVLVGLVRFQTLLLRMNPMQRESSETIEERLNTFGFSEEMVDRFFRPFLGGIFFNPELTTDSRLFDFVMRSLALGENCLPAKGIGAMAEQLVGRLDEKNVHANAKVQEIRNVNDAVEVRVQMMNKEEETIIRGKKVILAVEGPECDRLLGTKDKQREKGVGTTCVYFSCDKPYDAENAMLYLDGEKYKGGGGKKTLVNNCCFPSVVSPTYAPNGKHLCSASIIGVPSELSDEQIGDRVKSELSDWFGESITSSFKLLKVYRIPFAQPIQTPSAKGSSKTAFEQTCESGAMKNVYLAGDHRDAATFDGALISGRRCAEYAKSKIDLIMSSEYLTEEERKVLVALENKPLPLWRLFREALLNGGACRDIVEKHVMCKLNGTDLKFFYEVNSETRKLVKRSTRKGELKKSFKIEEMSSISTLEVAWEHIPWGTYNSFEEEMDEPYFCWQVARTNKLELLKWAREEKKCEWHVSTINEAARRGNLEMVKYCVANECPVDEGACGLAADGGHLEVLKYLREEAKAPWDSGTAAWAAENGHLHILEYLVERKYDEYDTLACERAAKSGHLDCLKYLHETAKAPWDSWAIREAHKKNKTECVQYLLDNNCPLPPGWRYEHGELHVPDSSSESDSLELSE
ncbi:unnamed protein product [Bathycoccus prasinos]